MPEFKAHAWRNSTWKSGEKCSGFIVKMGGLVEYLDLNGVIHENRFPWKVYF